MIKHEKKYAFLMGDYNVNSLIEVKSSTTQMQDFSNIFSIFYYHKSINLPTRERTQSSTLLDNIIQIVPIVMIREFYVFNTVRPLYNNHY